MQSHNTTEQEVVKGLYDENVQSHNTTEQEVVKGLYDENVQSHNTTEQEVDPFKTTEVIRSPCTGINGLVSSFVKLLREENPSRESTIVRTAGKLTPFHFNRIPEINDSNVPLATRRRQKRHNLKPNESISSESFCSICNSPLSRSDLLSLGNVETCHTNSVVFSAECCSSCQFQILPKDPVLVENFRTLLPQTLLSQAKHSKADNLSLLRAQIQDCLLSDAQDDET
ncbi:hypothetical protein L484_001855 [Morus notabilis]|uniref:Uncharacterized protein n=1 Tax=Morus notabilis TaxID=981085 RepID=W9QIK5_9ROSA|nr:hypothetical protein L484_001855 [Morus notabilis]